MTKGRTEEIMKYDMQDSIFDLFRMIAEGQKMQQLHRKIVDKIQELDFISYQLDNFDASETNELDIKEELQQAVNELQALLDQIKEGE